MKIHALTAASVAALMLAACGDNRTDDVVQPPAPARNPLR